jgi:arylsulfatase A-like enzyme
MRLAARGAALQPLPRHLALLAHPGRVLHRAEPPRGGDGVPGRHPAGLPRLHARLPKSAAALPRILRDAGYSTLAVGKWHLTPRWQRSAAGPFDTWPLGLGFERHYGFLQGDANHWAPNLVCDNHYIEAPRRPEEGYHLSEDLADQAIRMVQDQQQGAPGQAVLLVLRAGRHALAAPRGARMGGALPGMFDQGWDAWRREVFARQVEGGIVPRAPSSPSGPSGCAAGTSSARRARMHARQQEVFAGFLTHTDAQIGRLLASSTRPGLLENTLVMVFSDNGASAEGGKEGSVNEHRFTAHLRESVATTWPPTTTGAASAPTTTTRGPGPGPATRPHKLWKRYTWLGGTRTPLIVHWPGHVAEPGGSAPSSPT